MSEQEVFELGQLYAELYLIRNLISGGAGVRQRLLTQAQCDEIDAIGFIANVSIGKLMVKIDEHKASKSSMPDSSSLPSKND